MALKTDYKNFIPDENGRRYSLTQDAQGYTKINDETTYLQQGDNFGANDMNATNLAVNGLSETQDLTIGTTGWTSATDGSGQTYYFQAFQLLGIKSTDKPIISLKVADTISINTMKTNRKNFSNFFAYECSANFITIYTTKVPTAELTIALKGVGV